MRNKRYVVAVWLLLSACGGGGRALVRVDPEPAGSHCALVGTAIRSGTDKNGDGLLEDNTDGSPDTSFHTNGYLVVDSNPTQADQGQQILEDASHQIWIAGGTTSTFGDMDTAVWRLNAAGDLDATFGNNGLMTYPNPLGHTGFDLAIAMGAAPGGGIYVAGNAQTGLRAMMVLMRLVP